MPQTIHHFCIKHGSKPIGRDRLIGDRSFNAMAIGRALLGDQLLGVEDDPESANRQIARLKGDLYLGNNGDGPPPGKPERHHLSGG